MTRAYTISYELAYDPNGKEHKRHKDEHKRHKKFLLVAFVPFVFPSSLCLNLGMEAYMKRILMAGMVVGFLLSCAYGQEKKNAPPAGKKEHVFKGKVEKIDPNAKTFTINGEKVEGWMDSMTMVYVPDKEDVLKKVKVGDQITAKVYDGDFRTLHDVQVVAAKASETKAEPAAKDTKKDSKAKK